MTPKCSYLHSCSPVCSLAESKAGLFSWFQVTCGPMPSFLVPPPASAPGGSTLLWAMAEAWRARPRFGSSFHPVGQCAMSAQPSLSVGGNKPTRNGRHGKVTWHRACVREEVTVLGANSSISHRSFIPVTEYIVPARNSNTCGVII